MANTILTQKKKLFLNKIPPVKPESNEIRSTLSPRRSTGCLIGDAPLACQIQRPLPNSNLFSSSILNPDTCQNLVSTHAPQFWSKTSFYFEIKFRHDGFSERSPQCCHSLYPVRAASQKSSLPFTLRLLVHTIGTCRFNLCLFTHTLLQLNSGVKVAQHPHGRFIFPTLDP